MGLSGQQRKKLQDALIAAFPDKASLKQMLDYGLGKNLDAIAGGSDLKEIVFNLIKKAEAGNWIENLIAAAHNSNPGNSTLKEFIFIRELTTLSEEKLNQPSEIIDSPLLEIPVIGDEASEVGSDYTRLRDYLVKKEFGLADDETVRRMLWVARREEEGSFEEKHILNFPSRDLLTINQLWLLASKEKFGFSAQKQIWNYSDDFIDFLHKVEWSDDKKIVFDQRAVKGHLPLGVYVSMTNDCEIINKWKAGVGNIKQQKLEELEENMKILEILKGFNYGEIVSTMLDMASDLNSSENIIPAGGSKVFRSIFNFIKNGESEKRYNYLSLLSHECL